MNENIYNILGKFRVSRTGHRFLIDKLTGPASVMLWLYVNQLEIQLDIT